MQLNPTFISNVHDIYGESGGSWLKDLPMHLKQLSTLWNFRFLGPMHTLSYNFVGIVKMNSTGKTAIIKMAPKGGSVINEMRWLNCIDKGVPKIYAFDESLNAFLMEHLEPGNSLKGDRKSVV